MTDDVNDFDLPPMMSDRPTLKLVTKGQEVNISKLDPTLREITVGVGWDLRQFEGNPVDIDVSVFLLDKNNRTREDEDFIFYNNVQGRGGAVRHLGDSRTGAGQGDDEQIVLDLMALPFEIVKIAFVMSIYDIDLVSDFSTIKNFYFRIVNNENNHELFRFEMEQDSTTGTALHIGFLERIGSDWVYVTQGEAAEGGLAKVAASYDIVVAEQVRG